jgi:putative transposase
MVHQSRVGPIRAFIDPHHQWLTVVRLPSTTRNSTLPKACGPISTVSLGNLAARGVDQVAAIVENRLKRIQYRPELVTGFLTQTGLN